jgi:hypothetical protein
VFGCQGSLNRLYKWITKKSIWHYTIFKTGDSSDPLDTEKKIEQLIGRYNRFVESFFNVQVHSDDKEYTILEYYFDGLNPKENISFPSYILITAQNNFKIKYEITSKNLADVCKGELEFKFN